jgi:hypothetical protein
MKMRLVSIWAIAIAIAMGAFGAIRWSTGGATELNTPYQAVLLDNGEAYYGRIEGLGTAFPVLKEVYYVEHGVNPQTKEVNNILCGADRSGTPRIA